MNLKTNRRFALLAAVAVVLGLLCAYSVVQIRAEFVGSGRTQTSSSVGSTLASQMDVGLNVQIYASATNHTLLAQRNLPHDIITNNFINTLENFFTPVVSGGTSYYGMQASSGSTDYFSTSSFYAPCYNGMFETIFCSGSSIGAGAVIGVGGLNAPAGVTEYVSITLTNSQTTSTNGDTQVNININWNSYTSYLASNIQNVVFYDKYGYVLPAWCESGCTGTSTSSVVWVNLKHDIIAGNGGTLTIYLGFMSTSTNNFCVPNCASGNWGEYPQATSTYGQYDNGANVFAQYWNFAGTYQPSGIGYIAYTGNTVTYNNGVTLKGGTYVASGQYTLYTSNGATGLSTSAESIVNPFSYAVDFNGTFAVCPSSCASYEDSWFGLFSQISNGYYPWFNGYYNGIHVNGEPATGAAPLTSASATNTAGTYAFGQYNNGIFTSYFGSNYASYYEGYTTLIGSSTTEQSPNQMYYWGLTALSNQATSNPNGNFMQWLRERVAPPNDVMPSTVFGSATSGTGIVASEPAVARTDYSLNNLYGSYMVPTQAATYDGVSTVAVSASEVAISSGSISEAGLFEQLGSYYGNAAHSYSGGTGVQLMPDNVNNEPNVLMFHDNFTALSFVSGNMITVTYNLIMPSGSTNNFAHFMQLFMSNTAGVSTSSTVSFTILSGSSINPYFWWYQTSTSECGAANLGNYNVGCNGQLTSAFPSWTGGIGTGTTVFSNTQYSLVTPIGSYNAMSFTLLSPTVFQLTGTWTFTAGETYAEFGLFYNTCGYSTEPSSSYSIMFFRQVYTGVPIVANGGISESIAISF